MDFAELRLSETQFFMSFGFLSLFLATELGLAWVLVFFKWRSRGAETAVWRSAYRFWVRVFALAFMLAFAAAVPVLLQLGSLWPSLISRIGAVAGPILAAALCTTFVFKSCFIGAMLFGQRHLSARAHLAVVFMAALGTTVAAFWLVVLQSWMQTPSGAVLVEGSYQVTDWARVILNPSMLWHAALFIAVSLLAAAFLVLGVTARQALLHPLDEGGRPAFKTGLRLALAMVVLCLPLGAGLGSVVAHYQPAKAAATAAYWHGDRAPQLVLAAWPDAGSQENRYAWNWPAIDAWWPTWQGRVHLRALDQFSGMSPPVALTFWSFRIMVLVFGLMALVACATWLRGRRQGHDPSRLPRVWLRLLVGTTFSGWILCLAGLCHMLFGLSPFAVNETVTLNEVLGQAGRGELAAMLGLQTAVQGFLLFGFLRLLAHIERYGVIPVSRSGAGA